LDWESFAMLRRCCLLAAFVVLLWPGLGAALTISFNYELDMGVVQEFATATVSQTGPGDEDLLFVIVLDPVLGPMRDLHEFYFNLDGLLTGLTVTTDDNPRTPYRRMRKPSVAGGSGFRFDWGVNFGNGGGRKGNGRIQEASFVLSADQALTVDMLDVSSGVIDGEEQQAGIHVQGTDVTAANSETIVGSLPEPAAILLLALGMAGVSLVRRRPG
jgi:hypothetical protein